MLFFSRPQHSTTVLCCGLEKNDMFGAWHGMAWHGMASMNQTRPHCVNQMGKTHSKPLAARHGMGTACMCESAFSVRSGTRILHSVSITVPSLRGVSRCLKCQEAVFVENGSLFHGGHEPVRKYEDCKSSFLVGSREGAIEMWRSISCMHHCDGRKTITGEREGDLEECGMNKDQMKRAKKESRDEGRQRRNKEDRQCRYHWTWWRVRVTTTAIETQLCLVCTVELQVTVSTAMLSAGQKCFYGECASPATTKPTWVFM